MALLFIEFPLGRACDRSPEANSIPAPHVSAKPLNCDIENGLVRLTEYSPPPTNTHVAQRQRLFHARVACIWIRKFRSDPNPAMDAHRIPQRAAT
jgi:hypothetical protein